MTKVTLKIPDTKIITIILRSVQLSIQSVLRIAGAKVRRIQAHSASQLSFSTLIPGFFHFPRLTSCSGIQIDIETWTGISAILHARELFFSEKCSQWQGLSFAALPASLAPRYLCLTFALCRANKWCWNPKLTPSWEGQFALLPELLGLPYWHTYIERAIQAELSQSFSVLPDKQSLRQVKAKSKNLLAWNLSAVGFGRHNSGMESARGLSSWV